METLQLLRRAGGIANLAGGTSRRFDHDGAEIEWEGEWRSIVVSALGNEALLWMGLMAGRELRVEVLAGGTVEVRSLPWDAPDLCRGEKLRDRERVFAADRRYEIESFDGYSQEGAMRQRLGCVLLFCAAAGAPGAEPIDDLFAGWTAAQGKAESLVVEFALETKDTEFAQQKKATGTLRWLRHKNGSLYATYEVVADKPKNEPAERFYGLLNSRKVYSLDREKKLACRYEPTDGEMSSFLEWFYPFLILLDRPRAESKCHLQVVKQDEWYTHLSVKSMPVKPSGWFTDKVVNAQIVLMRNGSQSIPQGMPRQISTIDGMGGMDQRTRYDIKSWRWNPADAPKLEEFTKPEDRPGWTVVDGPFQRRR